MLGLTGTGFRRVLAFFLFAGIIYSASFGTVHTHGELSVQNGAGKAASSAQNATLSLNASGTTRTEADECLICTFHRQLSISTIDAPPFVVNSSPEIADPAALAVFYHSDPVVSEPDARLSGRAPPLAVG